MLCALVAAGLQSVAQLVPGLDRFGDKFLAGEGAYTGRCPRHEADGAAQHQAGSGPLAPGGAPLMTAMSAKKLLQIRV